MALVFAPGCGDDETGDDDDAPDAAMEDAPLGECLPVPSFADDLLLDADAAATMTGDVYRLAAAGKAVIACGDDYVGSLVLDAPCRALAIRGTDRVVAGTRDGALLLLSLDGNAIALLDTLPAVAARIYDVHVTGDRVLVAAGVDGVLEVSIAGDALAAGGSFGATGDARGLAAVGDDILVADGAFGLRMLDGATGAEIDTVAPLGVSYRVVVDGSRALLMRGAHGFDIIDVQATSLTVAASMKTLGAANDGYLTGQDVFVIEGSTLGRYRAGAAAITAVSVEDRPGSGQLVAPWFRAIAAAGGTLHVGLGRDVVPVLAGDGAPSPELAVSLTSTFLSADPGDLDNTVLVAANIGSADLVLIGAETATPFGATIPDQSQLQRRPNCPGQWIVPADTLFQVESDFRADDASTVVRALTIHTNDADEADFEVTLEGNRPAPAPGTASVDFALLTLDAERYQLSDHLGEVVFVKLFNFG